MLNHEGWSCCPRMLTALRKPQQNRNSLDLPETRREGPHAPRGGLSRRHRPLGRLSAIGHGFEQRVSRSFGSVGPLAQMPAVLSATVLALIQPQHVPRYVV